MHPSFGIEFVCPSLKWEDVLRGPSQSAVLAHTQKVLHYRSIFSAIEVGRSTALPGLEAARGVLADEDGAADRKNAA